MKSKEEQFVNELVKLKPVEFCGIAVSMGVSIKDEKNEPRPAEDIVVDVIDKYCSLRRDRKREFLKLIKQVNKE